MSKLQFLFNYADSGYFEGAFDIRDVTGWWIENDFEFSDGKKYRAYHILLKTGQSAVLSQPEHQRLSRALELSDGHMSEKEQITKLETDLDNLIDRYRKEFDMTYASVIGVLELAKWKLCNEGEEEAL